MNHRHCIRTCFPAVHLSQSTLHPSSTVKQQPTIKHYRKISILQQLEDQLPNSVHHVSRNPGRENALCQPATPLTPFQTTEHPNLPAVCTTLFRAKAARRLTFEKIGEHLGRNEVAAAAIFYGQAKASPEDIEKLADLLLIPQQPLKEQLSGFPDRGRSVEMPPKEPLIYRLYEIVQNYGYAYKAVLNEKFGDGIMSAISFSTKVEKETDEDGNNWAVITLRGKW